MKPHDGDKSSVFSTDLKPIIAEVARAEVCFPNIKLLVEEISLENISGTETWAFRLWLSDGEKMIQGMFSRLPRSCSPLTTAKL